MIFYYYSDPVLPVVLVALYRRWTLTLERALHVEYSASALLSFAFHPVMGTLVLLFLPLRTAYEGLCLAYRSSFDD